MQWCTAGSGSMVVADSINAVNGMRPGLASPLTGQPAAAAAAAAPAAGHALL